MKHKDILGFFTALAQIISLALVKNTLAEQQNITIDDAYAGGDQGISLRYLPVNGWATGNNCSTCSAGTKLDKSQVFNQTWHDATSMHDDSMQRSVVFNFTGMVM